jgi:hypothetical protein
LLASLGVSGEVEQWSPEHIVDKNEGTNVDVAWKDKDQSWTYCEVKLTEQEFGRAVKDQRHIDKLAKIYTPLLRDHCSSELLESEAFFGRYQILRNIWLAARDPRNRVVFLMPRQNEALWDPLQGVLGCLKSDLRARIQVISVELVIERLSRDQKLSAELRWYASMLAEKYVLSAANG